MIDKELIEEARDRAEHMKPLAAVTENSPGAAVALEEADRMTRFADALSVRQPSENDREAVKALNRALTNDGGPATREKALYDAAVLARRALLSRAAVPDVATEGDYHEGLEEGIKIGRAERDAALEAIERVRALHSEVFDTDHGKLCDECSDWGTGTYPAGQMIDWPCPTLMALDGAPEPEWECRWEYRCRLQSCGYVAEGYISAEHAMNGLKAELEDHPYLQMDDTAIVERARVREWLPVEGEDTL